MSSQDADALGREIQAAMDPEADISMLVRLSEHPHSAVRELVAKHRRTPVNVLVRMADDAEWAVRFRVARHPATPHPVVARLGEDPIDIVRRAVGDRMGMPGPFDDKDPWYDDPENVYKGPCIGGPWDGKLQGCEAPWIRPTRVVTDDHGRMVSTSTGMYRWSEVGRWEWIPD